MRKLLAPLLSACLLIAPTASYAAPRNSSPVGEAEAISGSPWLWIVLTAAALGLLIVLITDDNDAPESP